MPLILVTKPFPFAEDGNRIIQIETGEQQVSERCALVAVDHLKAATLVDGVKSDRKTKAKS